MRTHEDFCAEIARRKENIIKKRRLWRRVTASCVPVVICLVIFSAMVFGGLLEKTLPETTPSTNDFGDLESIKVTSPTGVVQTLKTEDSPSSRLKVLLAFIEENEKEFMPYTTNNNIYVETDNELLEGTEAENQLNCTDVELEEETVGEIQPSEAKINDSLPVNDITAESYGKVETSEPYAPNDSSCSNENNDEPRTEGHKNNLYSAQLKDENSYYFITVVLRNGDTKKYALDIETNIDLARELDAILSGIEN